MRPRLCASLALLALASVPAHAERKLRAVIMTADATLTLNATARGPRLLALRPAQGGEWINTAPADLPSVLERQGRHVPVHWHLVPRRCTVGPRRVTFVYESTHPHLRLLWQWFARARTGPLEHRVTLENLGTGSYWLTPMDSLRLAWRVAARRPLRQFYVEKGAGQPTA